jgi:multiple sugar transport system permease protein
MVRERSSSLWLLRKRAFPYFLLAPAIVVLCAVIAFPLIQGISFSFTDKFLTEPRFHSVGFQQFIKLFHDPMFWLSLKNSLVWTFCGVGAQVVLGFVIAHILNSGLKWEKAGVALFLIPWSMSRIIVSIVWMWLYNPIYGHLNYYLTSLGLPKIFFLADTHVALFFVLLTVVWRGTPFVMLVFLAGMKSLDQELFEAAIVDGANATSRLRFITLPLMNPLIRVITMLEIIWVFNEFDFIWIMTKGGPAGATHILSTYSYYIAFNRFSVGYGSAIGTVLFIVLIVISLLFLKLTEQRRV